MATIYLWLGARDGFDSMTAGEQIGTDQRHNRRAELRQLSLLLAARSGLCAAWKLKFLRKRAKNRGIGLLTQRGQNGPRTISSPSRIRTTNDLVNSLE